MRAREAQAGRYSTPLAGGGGNLALQLVEVTADHGHVDTLVAIGEQKEALDVYADEHGDMNRCLVRYVISSKRVQELLDALQAAMGAQANWRAVVLPVSASVPGPQRGKPYDDDDEETNRAGPFSLRAITVSRESIFFEVNRGARVDINFIILTMLSTVVAAIGMLTDNVAVVVGAMVIAPLLGPNLAFAFGTAVGDRVLMLRALGTNFVGIAISLVLSWLIGLTWSGPLDAPELLSRTAVGYENVALALASGAAAVLSLTTGLSATLVGVMVAVALLPPAAALGIFAGAGEWGAARNAALLLGINIVCVNLVAQIVFVAKGIGPRTWAEKQASLRARYINAGMWLVLLAALLVAIWYAREMGWTGAPGPGFQPAVSPSGPPAAR